MNYSEKNQIPIPNKENLNDTNNNKPKSIYWEILISAKVSHYKSIREALVGEDQKGDGNLLNSL